jgi:hypothetical protein
MLILRREIKWHSQVVASLEKNRRERRNGHNRPVLARRARTRNARI